MFGTHKKKLATNDIIALNPNTRELKKVVKQIEKDCAFVYHGFAFFDDDRMRARHSSFEISFAKLDIILRRLEKHIEAIERNAG